ncbi:MAG TPA: tRNA uridine-5-carboxymethylaminomethyl(34) synthesis GTPase MnmE [Candidatus Thioglobus sp.]|jgi:tRNA modification GTPase|uniref:GTPase and tRNA-U34 5-formylation enzyme TrmE n=1 Tax=hydrothermal vent metagenome TaxID=652676 RepID=A0A1W1DVB5_9ZZZZ|nr:tRNA uridine-5-carboxymethylaminomethyl(34) synthesis GTPase MnmE [Gammaproteobacteria bacterium]HIL20242.1 tRNA uridine-5-carboxymethylaminomethyl(34) synthesis GTPase MnmE [Candidatus Thioglobus sp.]HAE72571.1 tRNA uridine-5-carboxymethylaminomethyl(34) synthesis GTPase MnmE [Gammaproteobacteria bacterium]HAG47794.1 tRNA uridine-5-carboxymethylaminomethyl(34) synthesis GTPase MnmE [Gammaproteobacteria bacterium]HAN32911.1 tRNA uridine-5-carboxymethylaminomethyl(34) synthesis GTPase MnmE [G
MSKPTTICALASALGQGGIGVVRVSGPQSGAIAQKMLGHVPKARYAHYGSFFNQEGVEIDKGVALFFPGPNSFTGEDVLELQGHGGILVMRSLLESAMALSAVAAEPGEFSKRAFLNGKMDLVQAEAVADIIDASSEQSARSALRSLSGEFSNQVNALTKALIELRVFVEATIDFSDEEIDFLASGEVKLKVEQIEDDIQNILSSAEQGAILREGLTIAIAGKPNAGKSSLLNALTQVSSAIVTDIAGTTRDVLKETIHVNGMPLNIIDTAGLHISEDKIEQEGIKRAHSEIERADVILMVFDAQDKTPDLSILPSGIEGKPIILIKNKVDLTDESTGITHSDEQTQLSLSAKQSQGIDLLRQELSNIAGLSDTGEGVLLARKRHIIALESALDSTRHALDQLSNNASELVAEDLRQAAQYLGSITGEFSSDDLLGEIFSSFCIGK